MHGRRAARLRIDVRACALAAAVLLGTGPTLIAVSAQPQGNVAALEQSLVGLSPAAREQKLFDGARHEGAEVIAYLTWNERQSQDVTAQFQKRYPFMRVRVLRGGSGDIANRILTEGRAGRATWDAAEVDTDFIPSLRTAHLLGRYTNFARSVKSTSSSRSASSSPCRIPVRMAVRYRVACGDDRLASARKSAPAPRPTM